MQKSIEEVHKVFTFERAEEEADELATVIPEALVALLNSLNPPEANFICGLSPNTMIRR